MSKYSLTEAHRSSMFLDVPFLTSLSEMGAFLADIMNRKSYQRMQMCLQFSILPKTPMAESQVPHAVSPSTVTCHRQNATDRSPLRAEQENAKMPNSPTLPWEWKAALTHTHNKHFSFGPPRRAAHPPHHHHHHCRGKAGSGVFIICMHRSLSTTGHTHVHTHIHTPARAKK